MKFAAALLLVASAFQVSALRRLTETEHSRFLQEKDEIADQIREWKKSDAGQYAMDNGFVDPSLNDDSNEVTDDELQRFFMTKLGIEDAQKANPEAQFSTNTPFTMMTEDEFAQFVGESFNRTAMDDIKTEAAPDDGEEMSLDASGQDWTTSGCVAPIKNQGSCGSCWAFASVTSLESAYCLANSKKFTRFSEQQVTSCDKRSYGCNGGFPTYALNFIKTKGSICTSQSYPYTSGTSQQTGSCKSSCTSVPVSIKSIVNPTISESGFISALNSQPFVVTVSAGNSVWKQYRGGVVTSCPSAQLDHAVTAVGYGTSTSNYYKIQNSWGSSWGDKGFIYLSRSGSTCGVVNRDAVYPKF